MKKEYLKYILPSTLSFLLTGIYSIVDGIFVGRAMGDAGLAAINIAWPLVALIFFPWNRYRYGRRRGDVLKQRGGR